jgi:hypothetical protein
VEISVDEAEGTGLLRQRSRRCPDDLKTRAPTRRRCAGLRRWLMNRPSSQCSRTHTWGPGTPGSRATTMNEPSHAATGSGYAQVGVASESAKPGHLGTDRVRRMNPRSIDAQ